MIFIREANTEDIPTIQTIANITWPKTFALLMSEAQVSYMIEMMYSTSALEHQMDKEDHHYLLAFYNGKAVGYSSYELNYKSEPHLMMHKLYLLPSSQGLGVGRSIINYLHHIAQEQQQKLVQLQVLNTNQKAKAFYEKLEFKKVRQVPKVLDDGMGIFIDNVMVKEL